MVWLLNSNSLIDPGILAMKGEYCFPNLDFDIAKMTFDLRCIKKSMFHQHNLDQLHNSGDCQDDFKVSTLADATQKLGGITRGRRTQKSSASASIQFPRPRFSHGLKRKKLELAGEIKRHKEMGNLWLSRDCGQFRPIYV